MKNNDHDLALHTIEICAGVGMLGEGLRAGLAHLGIPLRTVADLEREAYPASCLAARCEEGSLDGAPVWSDLLTFDAGRWAGAVDGIAAGFPCQDLSLAGRRAGLDGKRSGLFFNILDIADASGAWFLFLENVAGIASATASVVDEAEGDLEERAAARVLGELADRGWHAEWLTLSASDVGASHKRERWFCFAWRTEPALANTESQRGGEWQRTERAWGTEIEGAGAILGNTKCSASRTQRANEPGERANSPTRASEQLGHTRLQHQQLQQRHERAEPERANGELDDSPQHGRREGRTESAGQQRRPDSAECGGAMADTCSTGQQGSELGRALHGNRGGAHAHGPVEQLRRPLFAPGPADQRWTDIIRDHHYLAPALEPDFRGSIDGMAFAMDESRAQRLKCIGNGVVALQAAAAFVVLARRAGLGVTL